MASEPIVRCASCNRPLPEPPNTPMEQRKPCRNCGGMNRTYDLTLTATVFVQPDLAQPGMTQPALPADALDVAGSLEEAGYDLSWARLPEGAWMVLVRDRQGQLIDISIQDERQDALLAVAETLLGGSDS